jgi:transposase
MIRRHELTDAEWALLEPLMPKQPRQGHRWADHRTVINGILWRTRTGTPWRDLPPRYGNWKTVYGRHRRWSADGTWARIADALRIDADTGEATELTASVDSSSARVHQHAAGARRRAPQETDGKGGR